MSKSIGIGGASAYPLIVRNEKSSSVEVNSIPINRAPRPTVRPLASVGTVRIISGAASESSCATTGLGRRRRGASESVSVPESETLPQSFEPVLPSSLQTHIFPEFSSIVVATTTVFWPSS